MDKMVFKGMLVMRNIMIHFFLGMIWSWNE